MDGSLLGLRQIQSLEEALEDRFLVDANYSGGLAVYPVTSKAHISHGLLSLYGTHWSYIIEDDNQIRRRDGDLARIISGERPARACYNFTQKYLDAHASLMLFVPATAGWLLRQQIMLHHSRDLFEYKQSRRARMH